jgi:hypothetical protein
MGNRSILSVTGTVKIEHQLGQTAVTIRRAQESIAQQKHTLCEQQAAQLDAVESSLSGAMASVKLSIQLFKSVRPLLRPMDAAEERLIEELVDSGVIPKASTQR